VDGDVTGGGFLRKAFVFKALREGGIVLRRAGDKDKKGVFSGGFSLGKPRRENSLLTAGALVGIINIFIYLFRQDL
jgi:hypothetical protein